MIVTENPKAKRHSYASFSCGSPRWFVSLIDFLLNRLIRLSMLKYLCLGFSNDHFQDDTRLLRGILPWPFPLVSTNLTRTFLQTSPLGEIGTWRWVEPGFRLSRTPSCVVNVENEMKRSTWMSLREFLLLESEWFWTGGVWTVLLCSSVIICCEVRLEITEIR